MRLAARLVAAVVLTAATTALPVAPAHAAACTSADGVTVVVDYHELGGGVGQVCDAGGAGKSAAAQFADAGFALTRVQRQPGFICRVQGKPASDPCVNTPPADAYWGLWWSDGKSGSWTYATQGVDSLTVPRGGSVALSWNGSASKSAPGVAPAKHASPSPSPTPTPTKQPSPQPGGGSSGSSGSAGDGGRGGGGGQGASGSAQTGPSATPSNSATPTPSSAAAPKPGAKPGVKTGDSTRNRAGDEPSDGPDKTDAPDKRERKDDRKQAERNRDDRDADPSGSPTASDSPETTTAASPTSEPPSSDAGGMPAWVAPSAIGLLFAAAAATAVVRRRRGSAGT
jgi:hypothetical protein